MDRRNCDSICALTAYAVARKKSEEVMDGQSGEDETGELIRSKTSDESGDR